MIADEGSAAETVLVAKPRVSETVALAAVLFVGSITLTAFISFGIDAAFPGFVTDDFATNRLRMGTIFVLLLTTFALMILFADQDRYYRLFSDRLVIGRRQDVVVEFASIKKIRVGAPMPAIARKARAFNEGLGKISAPNAGAASMLTRSYAYTVVIEKNEPGFVVINLGSVAGGDEMLRRLVDLNIDKVEQPASYTSEELGHFGKFKPGRYERTPTQA